MFHSRIPFHRLESGEMDNVQLIVPAVRPRRIQFPRYLERDRCQKMLNSLCYIGSRALGFSFSSGRRRKVQLII